MTPSMVDHSLPLFPAFSQPVDVGTCRFKARCKVDSRNPGPACSASAARSLICADLIFYLIWAYRSLFNLNTSTLGYGPAQQGDWATAEFIL